MIYVYLIICWLCGTYAQDGEREYKVIGGEQVDIGKLPYVVHFTYASRSACTGSIVGPRWVLTAKHCVPETGKTKHYKITAGTVKPSEKTKDAQIRNSEYAEKYPDTQDSNGKSIYVDLGLIRTDSPFRMTSRWVAALKLTSIPWPPKEARECTACGFGKTKNPSTEGRLMMIKKIRSGNRVCTAYTRSKLKKSDRHTNFVCLLPLEREGSLWPGVCDGDSGSPLVYNMTIVGVASGLTPSRGDPETLAKFRGKDVSKYCGDEDVTSFYTDVYPYLDWVLPIINGAQPTSFEALFICLLFSVSLTL